MKCVNVSKQSNRKNQISSNGVYYPVYVFLIMVYTRQHFILLYLQLNPIVLIDYRYSNGTTSGHSLPVQESLLIILRMRMKANGKSMSFLARYISFLSELRWYAEETMKERGCHFRLPLPVYTSGI